ncbi:MAG: DUF6143 family protein [Oscillospiraceae bacterium]|nr:DUF6143 family protein [Oscillospiraceae bacterium]
MAWSFRFSGNSGPTLESQKSTEKRIIDKMNTKKGWGSVSDMNTVCSHELPVKPLQQVVDLTNPLYQSLQGKYFIGQTPTLFVGNGSNAWAALCNPPDSHRNLFFNVFTISNFSSSVISAKLWLNAVLSGDSASSSFISPTNTALTPKTDHKVQLRYVQSTGETPSGGVNIFGRIVPPYTTLASEEDGKIIIPPGGNVLLFLTSSSPETINAIVAFGWWETREEYSIS